MPSPKVWRRVVFLKWKKNADPGALARAFNLHKSFPRSIPAVLSVSEGVTFTSGVDGGGAYPGESDVNMGFDSAIELIVSCSTQEELRTRYFEHPAHIAAAKIIDPLVEDAWAMDWVEDRDTLVVPSATASFVKHIAFFQFQEQTTQAQRSALLGAWRELPSKIPGVLAVSCNEPVQWERGEKRGFHAGIVADLALTSGDGVPELNHYHTHEAFQTALPPLRSTTRHEFSRVQETPRRQGVQLLHLSHARGVPRRHHRQGVPRPPRSRVSVSRRRECVPGRGGGPVVAHRAALRTRRALPFMQQLDGVEVRARVRAEPEVQGRQVRDRKGGGDARGGLVRLHEKPETGTV